MTSGAQGGGGGEGGEGGWRDRPRAAGETLNSVDPSSRWRIFP